MGIACGSTHPTYGSTLTIASTSELNPLQVAPRQSARIPGYHSTAPILSCFTRGEWLCTCTTS